jgi:hypothetical protein
MMVTRTASNKRARPKLGMATVLRSVDANRTTIAVMVVKIPVQMFIETIRENPTAVEVVIEVRLM